MTKVIFRKFQDDEIIALFPQLVGTRDPYTCNAYMELGQHSSASVEIVYNTKLATKEEYSNLLQELKQIGYDDLKIGTKFTRYDFECRKSQL